MAEVTGLAYGPVPSRRLGKSLGINNVLPKICTYSCAYCQLGYASGLSVERRFFYNPEDIFKSTVKLVEKAIEAGEKIDYLCFVPDGEPTLDINLGKTIKLLQKIAVPVGVITNSSLLWRDDVREELSQADWVSIKIDAIEEPCWRKINHPHRSLDLAAIIKGIENFTRYFKGKLVTETMIAGKYNDNEKSMQLVADFIGRLNVDCAYLSIPTRPPAEKRLTKPDEEFINLAYQILSEKIKKVEYLIGYEGNDFAFTGDVEKDILSITAVHPMREDAIAGFLKKAEASDEIITRLVATGKLRKIEYGGHVFYLRKFSKG
jgi:wyosine [tRNA(Phe)-imidazoG37] synthetase (radical SAM superfamily)